MIFFGYSIFLEGEKVMREELREIFPEGGERDKAKAERERERKKEIRY